MRTIDGTLSVIGRVVSLLTLLIIFLIVLEMIMRGVFARPSPWAHELSTWLLTALVFLGGPYALIQGKFVRVDIFFSRMNSRSRAIVDSIFSTTLMIFFVGVLFWLGGKFFLSSLAIGETSATGNWGGPVWAAKLMIPLGTLLLALGWISHLLHLWQEVYDEKNLLAQESSSPRDPVDGVGGN